MKALLDQDIAHAVARPLSLLPTPVVLLSLEDNMSICSQLSLVTAARAPQTMPRNAMEIKVKLKRRDERRDESLLARLS